MESIRGKKAKGFEFEGRPTFMPSMIKYIGVVGTITGCNTSTASIGFDDGESWMYPYPEILNHLVDDEPELEEEIDIDILFQKIKNL